MKHLLIILVALILALAGCSGGAVSYAKWSTADGWSDTMGKAGKIPTISLEYPAVFQKYTQTDYDAINKFINMNTTGGNITNTVEFARPINAKAKPAVTDFVSWSKIRIILHISDEFVDFVVGWKINSSGNGTAYKLSPSDNWTALEYYLKAVGSVSQSTVYDKQITVNGIQAYTAKYEYLTPSENGPYKSRILIITLFQYKGDIVEIFMNSFKDEAGEVEKYYNHVLDTFKISD